ncbi:MAG: two-component system sensor histidine kinase NtrB [Hyphomicrobium sp.]
MNCDRSGQPDMHRFTTWPSIALPSAGAGGLNGQARCDETLSAKLALQSSLLDQIALVHEMSPDGRITRVNDLMCAKLGRSVGELIGARHDLMNFDVGDAQCWRRLHKEVTPGELWAGETLNRTRDGSDLWLSSTIAAVRDGAGALTGYICASIDVTERSRLREEFDRNGKLMQLGQLTATVAHEIRNPLGAIRTANFVIERKLKGRVDGVDAQLERINNGISRCDKIITELLDFSRNRSIKATAQVVDDWIASVVEEESRNLFGAPSVVCNLGLGGVMASFDADQMRQVLINLLSNAAEALAEKTKAGAIPGYSPRINIHTIMDGPHVSIIVKDNGPGIDPKHLKRIREPLFTTKSFGVGLGIPAIEKILENHGGQLTIESQFGAGATITASFAHQNAAADAA